jgi:hypothetical protein
MAAVTGSRWVRISVGSKAPVATSPTSLGMYLRWLQLPPFTVRLRWWLAALLLKDQPELHPAGHKRTRRRIVLRPHASPLPLAFFACGVAFSTQH